MIFRQRKTLPSDKAKEIEDVKRRQQRIEFELRRIEAIVITIRRTNQ